MYSCLLPVKSKGECSSHKPFDRRRCFGYALTDTDTGTNNSNNNSSNSNNKHNKNY